MRTRVWRLILLIILLAGGAGAALSSWTSSRQIVELDHSQREMSDGVDRLLATLDAVITAQQTPVTVSPDQDPPAEASRLIEQFRSETDRLQPHVRSIEGGRALQSVAASVSTLRDIDARAQEHLRLGQDLMAADLLSSDGRSADEAIGMGLRSVRAAENDAFATARADALDSVWTIAGSVAAFWVLGLILLTRRPSVVREESTSAAPAHTLLAPADTLQETAQPTPIDLQSAADVCTALGQMTSADDLPRLLQQAAAVLNASGVVVWMAAGEDLFAAAAFGYPPHVMQKLGPIRRGAVNATAAAWRSGTVQTVSGNGAERSALAAPMLGAERCIGVLAVEVGVGQEGNAATRAVTSLFAAQLAAALAGWPAASSAAPVQAPPLDRAAEA
jgi:hypothetical protein